MEDAIALYKAIGENKSDLPAALARFEEIRRPALEKLVGAATASAVWYEQIAEHMQTLPPYEFARSYMTAEHMQTLPPYEFARSYMTRTGRISDERLEKIAPKFMERYAQHVAS
jgi:2-polyprenyl-6-methoxyphenol hydroxylase-like FAD-dependent oxidoreductase